MVLRKMKCLMHLKNRDFQDEKEEVKISGMTDLHLEINKDIYNPWSIINFLDNLKKYKTYWADSSSNGLVNELIRTAVQRR